MADTFNLSLDWPHTDAHAVIVTGTFDNWSSSVHLNRSECGFTSSVAVPWGSKILYKFIVDGNWITRPDQPTETNPDGFVNNVVHTPVKPVAPRPTEAAEKEGAVLLAQASELEVALDYKQTKENVEAPVEVAPLVPVVIQPVLDGSTDTLSESRPVDSEGGPSTHAPAPASDVVAESTSVPEAKPVPVLATAAPPAPAPEVAAPTTAAGYVPSTPPPAKSELPVSLAPLTPIKTNGTGHGHARTSTGTTTPPSSSAPSTPKTHSTFPEGEDASLGSIGRKRRLSLFHRLKAKLTPEKDKKEKKRLGSASPRSASPSPRKGEK